MKLLIEHYPQADGIVLYSSLYIYYTAHIENGYILRYTHFHGRTRHKLDVINIENGFHFHNKRYGQTTVQEGPSCTWKVLPVPAFIQLPHKCK